MRVGMSRLSRTLFSPGVVLALLIYCWHSLAATLVATDHATLLRAVNDPDSEIVEVQQHIRALAIRLQPNSKQAIIGNCTDASERIPEHLERETVNSKHCIIDFQHVDAGFDVPSSSSLWLSDLIITNARPASTSPDARKLLQAPCFPSSGVQACDAQGSDENIVTHSAGSVPPAPATSADLKKMQAAGPSNTNGATGDRGTTVTAESGAALPLPQIAAADGSGGAVHIAPGTEKEGGNLYAQRIIFFNNHAVNGGAVGLSKFALAQMVDCVFDSNSASGYGGALLMSHASKANVSRALLDNNSAVVAGFAYIQESSTLVLNADCWNGLKASCINEETVVPVAANSSHLPKVYVDVPALTSHQVAGFLPLQDAPLHLWSDAEDANFSQQLQTELSTTSLGRFPESLEIATAGPQSSAPQPAPIGSRMTNIWDRHQGVFIALIAISVVCIVAIAYFMCKIRCLTPRQDFGMLYPPTDNSRVFSGSPNILPPEVAPVCSFNSTCTDRHVNEGLPVETHVEDRDDRRGGSSSRITTMSSMNSKEQELEMVCMPSVKTGARNIERDEMVLRISRPEMKHADENTSAFIKPIASGILQRSVNSSPSKASPVRNKTPDNVTTSEAFGTSTSLGAGASPLLMETDSLGPGMKISRMTLSVRSPMQLVPSRPDELLGSPAGEDSLMSNQSLLDMNTEDPFKAGEGVRAVPPHSSPYAQSPLAHPDQGIARESHTASGVFWTQLENSQACSTSKKGIHRSEECETPASALATPCSDPLSGSACSTGSAALLNSEAVVAIDVTVKSVREEVSVAQGGGSELCDGHVQGNSDQLGTASHVHDSTCVEETHARSRGGGDGEDVTQDGAGGPPRRKKWSRRGILDKARRPNAHDSSSVKDLGDLGTHVGLSKESDRSAPAMVSPEFEASLWPISAEAALLGEVERMPDELDVAAVGNPFAKRTSALSPGVKMKPSSFFQANEIKQSKRNRKMIATRGMLNRAEAPAAQLFAISEQAEIRYTNNGLLYEVPADEIMTTPRQAATSGTEEASHLLAQDASHNGSQLSMRTNTSRNGPGSC